MTACLRGHDSGRYKNGNCSNCAKERSKNLRSARGFKRDRKIAARRWYENSPWRFMYDRARRRARSRSIEFDITTEYIKAIWPSDNRCPVLKQLFRFGDLGRMCPNSPSLDRIDPTRGYVKGNVAVISMAANQMKSYCTSPKVLRDLADWIESQLPR